MSMGKLEKLTWFLLGLTLIALTLQCVGCSGGGCDAKLDRLTEARSDYHDAKSWRGLSEWRDAAREYCKGCDDFLLCQGTQPR